MSKKVSVCGLIALVGACGGNVPSGQVGSGGPARPTPADKVSDDTVFNLIAVATRPDGTQKSRTSKITRGQQRAMIAARQARRQQSSPPAASRKAAPVGLQLTQSAIDVEPECPDDAIWMFDQTDLTGNTLCLAGQGIFNLLDVCLQPSASAGDCAFTWLNNVRSFWAGPEAGSLMSNETGACAKSVVSFNPFDKVANVPLFAGSSRTYPIAFVELSTFGQLCTLPSFEQIADFPQDHSFEAANDIQGVTHDANNWFFTQAKTEVFFIGEANESFIWKTPVGTDLRNSPSRTANPWAHTHTHFGDVTLGGDGNLYVALESGSNMPLRRGAIGVFDRNLNFFPEIAELDDPDMADNNAFEAPWVAFNPKDGFFYLSQFNSKWLKRYRITAGFPVQVTFVDRIPFLDAAGNQVTIPRIQGGEFSPSGTLYLTSDVDGGGIVALNVDPSSARIVNPRIFVEFHKDEEDEEIEGVTVWDLDDGRAPGIGGQLHVLMIQNDDFSNDNLYFKHVRASDRNSL